MNTAVAEVSDLTVLGDVLRQDGGAGALAGGLPVPRPSLERWIGARRVAGLVDGGFLHAEGGALRLALPVDLRDGLLLIRPTQTGELYLGPDSAYLAEAAMRLGRGGDRAVDLGAGTGLLAVLLLRNYRLVVATDIVPRAAKASYASLAYNPGGAGHASGAVVADVAGGLRAGAFDLVTANCPWVPSVEGGERRVFADGGPTGSELPARFLREGAELLAPGGTMVALALDITCDDGSQPLRVVTSGLESAGYTVVTLATPVNTHVDVLSLASTRQPRIVQAVHVAVVVGRPVAPAADREALRLAAVALGRRWARWSP